MTPGKLFGLILCNLLWSGAYAVSKNLMAHYHPLEITFLRHFFGLIPLLVIACWGLARSPLARWARGFGGAESRRVDPRLLAVGVLTFFVSPLFQMTGLNQSRAIDGSLMIALEPLATVLAAWLVLRERLRGYQIASLGLAIVGAGVLSEVTWGKVAAFSDARLVGNSIFFLSLFCEAAFSILSKPVLHRRSPVLFMTVATLVGVACLFTYNVAVDGPSRLGGLAQLLARGEWTDWLVYLYLGLGCTFFGYLYWLVVLQDVPVSILAMTLYIQPVLGMVWGSLFLGEVVSASTLIGAFLILTAVGLGSQPPRGYK